MTTDSLGLRIAALFTILASSLIGVTFPELCSRLFKSRTDPVHGISYMHIVKLLGGLGTGAVIATGLCHIAPDANANMTQTLGVYPSAFAIATGTIVVLYIIERELHLAVERRMEKALAAAAQRPEEVAPPSSPPAVEDAGKDTVLAVASQQDQEKEEDDLELVRQSLVTHILEVGVAVHSVVIGVALGLLTNSNDVQPLFIALVFHQFCEGTAIGASVLQSSLGTVHTVLLWLIFVVTTPIGVAIGIGAEMSQGSQESNASVETQGILESIAMGILLYMGLFDMLPSLFEIHGCGHHAPGHRRAFMPMWYRLTMYGCLSLGAGAMVLIANWA